MDLRKSHAEKNIEGIDRATEALNAAWQVASAEMYKNAGANAQGGQTGGDGSDGTNNNAGGAEYTDVDYEEVKK